MTQRQNILHIKSDQTIAEIAKNHLLHQDSVGVFPSLFIKCFEICE